MNTGQIIKSAKSLAVILDDGTYILSKDITFKEFHDFSLRAMSIISTVELQFRDCNLSKDDLFNKILKDAK